MEVTRIKQRAMLNLLATGLDSAIAAKAIAAGLTLSRLRAANKKELDKLFTSHEVTGIRTALQRQVIAEDVIIALVEKCDWSCCVCWNLDKSDPVIIHHIVGHAKTADDTYENLVVLCLNHHGIAHSTWEISRPPLPATLIRARKAAFEVAVSEFKAGTRAAPGREGDGSDPASQSDIEALNSIARFLSRAAVYRPFRVEGNMQEFLTAMEDIMRTLNTGIMRTREGEEIGRTKSVRQFSNPGWSERMDLLSREFDSIIERVQVAIRAKELAIDSATGSYSFENPDLPDEIDAARHSAIRLFNGVLFEAGIGRVRGPGDQ